MPALWIIPVLDLIAQCQVAAIRRYYLLIEQEQDKR